MAEAERGARKDGSRGSWASSPAVRRNMQANRRRDTKPELAVRRLLHASGLRFRVQYPVDGNARRTIDIAFTKRRVACFIDGCFWHGCPTHFVPPMANAAFWRAKIDANVERDAETNRTLRSNGWTVMRFWEHEEALDIAEIIGRSVRRASSG